MKKYWMALAFLAVGCATSAVVKRAKEVPTEDPPEGAPHPLLAKVIEAGPYEPQWRSLVSHPTPKWYTDDRVGVTAHWGIYAVPGWTERKDTPYGVAYEEWYWQWMQQYPVVKAHQKEHYGDARYDDFIDGVTDLTTGQKTGFWTKRFDPDAWMKLFKRAGAKYFVLTSKHHEGFCLFKTSTTDRNSVAMGPHRDLCGEIVAAARRNGLKVGFYYSFYEWYNPYYTGKGKPEDYKGCTPLKDADGDGKADEYVDDYMIPQLKELIDQYHPDCLYFDGEWEHGYVWWRAREVIAYYYNQAAARGQEVAVNDRFGQTKEGCSDTRGVYGDLKHVEYFANVDKSEPWAMWRGFGNSYGYNSNENPANILSRENAVKMIVNCAAAGGNTEFNVGPKADGTLAEWDTDRLEGMGEWMKVNGESIYGTTASPLGTLQHGRMTHNAATGTLYYHVFDWPEDGAITITGIGSRVTSAMLLCNGAELKFSQDGNALRIAVPPKAPDEYVTVIALKYKNPFALAAQWLYPQTAELRANLQKARARGINLADYHLHIRNGMTPEKAIARQSLTGIESGMIENEGREWPLSDSAKVNAFIDSCKAAKTDDGKVPLVGIQVNDRDWFRQLDPAVMKRLDYVVADTMIMGTGADGKPQRLWLPDLKIADPEAWMEEYLAHNLQILGEPISILANSTYLPACIADKYDQLWTEERMRLVIEKAVKNHIAIEIQAESKFPTMKFLKLAKQMGAKFSFGTNNHDDRAKDLSAWFNAIEALDLKASDLWTPAKK